MKACNYIPLNTSHLDPEDDCLDDLFDLDILHTDDGILINVPQAARRVTV